MDKHIYIAIGTPFFINLFEREIAGKFKAAKFEAEKKQRSALSTDTARNKKTGKGRFQSYFPAPFSQKSQRRTHGL